MNICILGATGRVGSILLKNALMAGHSVNVLVRNQEKLKETPYHAAKVNAVIGNALNEADLLKVIHNAEVVFSTLNFDGNSTLSSSTPLIIKAMKNCGVRRIITIGTAGILQSRFEPGLYRFQSKESRNRTTKATEDHLAAYLQLKKSALDWTVVCPTYLPDGERIGSYRFEKDYLPLDGRSISIYDTADFAFLQAFSPEFIGFRVGICY